MCAVARAGGLDPLAQCRGLKRGCPGFARGPAKMELARFSTDSSLSQT